MYPLDIPSPSVAVTIVAGPPGAGKTTYVLTRAQPGDMVLDLDDIRGQLPGRSLTELLEVRNAQLRALPTEGRLWFIVTAAHAGERSFWSRTLNADVILILPDSATCQHRINTDSARLRDREQRSKAMERWFQLYTERAADVVITGDKGSPKV